MKRKFIIYIVLGIAILLFTLSYISEIQPKLYLIPKNVSTEATSTGRTATSTQTQKIPVSLSVLDKTYNAEIPVGSTVYDLMTKISSTTNFRFNAKLFSGLGYFIDEINGIKNTSNAYWFYYLNGNRASVGISAYTLKPNDVISWKFESGM